MRGTVRRFLCGRNRNLGFHFLLLVFSFKNIHAVFVIRFRQFFTAPFSIITCLVILHFFAFNSLACVISTFGMFLAERKSDLFSLLDTKRMLCFLSKKFFSIPATSFVFRVLNSNESTMSTSPSVSFFDNTDASATLHLLFIFLKNLVLLFGPCDTPPPFQIGERVEPARAFPVCFLFVWYYHHHLHHCDHAQPQLLYG